MPAAKKEDLWEIVGRTAQQAWGAGLREAFFLFIVESPVIVFGWVLLVAFVRGVGDYSRDRVYFIAVDQIVSLIHVGITHSK
jgi:hypothetical protein